METQQRRSLRDRKPLSDRTNTLNSSSSSSFLLKPQNPTKSTSACKNGAVPKPHDPLLSSAFSRILSSTNSKPSAAGHDVVAKPSSILLPPVASTPSRPPRSSSSAPAADGCEVFEPCSVYTRRQSTAKRKSKGKEIAEPFTCIPALKTRKIGSYDPLPENWAKTKEDGVSSLSKACTVPHKKKQRHMPSEKNDDMHALPQDFIKQQRAYFAEIDAFELPEEEVNSVEELD